MLKLWVCNKVQTVMLIQVRRNDKILLFMDNVRERSKQV